eukprot:1155687-Pelagomonas_calceolata.AAC.4
MSEKLRGARGCERRRSWAKDSQGQTLFACGSRHRTTGRSSTACRVRQPHQLNANQRDVHFELKIELSAQHRL